MTDGLIENVARRLQIIVRSRYLSDRPRSATHVLWELMHEEEHESYRLAARSLIEAICIPTSAMKAKGDAIAPASIRVWQAMINEALCEI